MVKIFTMPFAANGTKETINDLSQPDGKVSYEDGFTTDYELPDTDPNYKPIERSEFNGLMHDVTGAVGALQQIEAQEPRVKWASGDKIITVANSGADFTTVMGAIAEAMKWRSIDGSVIVEIKSGYLVKEQLIFTDNDYSHINIKAQGGATIIADPNSMSVTNFEGSGFSGFIICARGKSPMFQTQFEFSTRPASTINGALGIYNGTVSFGNNSGVKNAGSDGAAGSSGGSVTMGSNNNFSNAGGHGALGYIGGSVTMGDANDFSNADGDGAVGSFGGSVTMGNNNNFSGAGGNGAAGSSGGSVTMGSNNNFSNAGASGAFGYIGGSVTMGSNNNFSNAGADGAFGFRSGSVTMGNNNNFSGAGANGALGYIGGSVTMGDANDFSNAGHNGAYGFSGGSVTMGDGNDFSNAGGNGAFGASGGSVTMGDGNDFSNAGGNGAYGFSGGSVTMGSNNNFSGISSGNYSLTVVNNGLVQTGINMILTNGRERNQAAYTITASGLIMG